MRRRWRRLLDRRALPIDEALERIQALPGIGEVRRDEPMARHTSYRIGGPADLYVVVEEERGLQELLPLLGSLGIPWVVLGAGANVLVLDGGIRGAVVTLGKGFAYLRDLSEAEAGYDRVEAGAALKLAHLLKEARRRGWEALAPLAGTPGTIGGAVKMNAGDRRTGLGDFVERVRIVTREGRVRELERAALHYGYRTSRLPRGAIVTAARLRLPHGDPERARAAIEAHIAKRRATQPLSLPSGGSVFRNPPEGHAGELIERVGLKGVRLRRAQISPLHANFIVNLGGARARDVLALIRLAKERVRQETGVQLEEELWVIGEPGEEEDG